MGRRAPRSFCGRRLWRRSLNVMRWITCLKRWRLRTIGIWGSLLLILVGLGLWINPPQLGDGAWFSRRVNSGELPSPCWELVNEQGKITSADWQWFKFISPGTAQAQVSERLGQPYCVLPPLYVQVDVLADRHVYQFEASQRWLIVLYEAGKYVEYEVVDYGAGS